MKQDPKTDGYYYIRITSDVSSGPLLASNSERAFIISKLQDFLSPRLVIHELPIYKQLPSCIDLLAFSIQSRGIELLLFSIDQSLCRSFVEQLVEVLLGYQYEIVQYAPHTYYKRKPKIQVLALSDIHEAFATSLRIHALHTDWEYDRYSSIGFYLHDRRGDWMRTWRLTQIYDAIPDAYRKSMLQCIRKSSKKSWLPTTSFPLVTASSTHG